MLGETAEIVTAVLERMNGKSIAFRRMGYASAPCPTTKNLENLYYPNPATIAQTAHGLVRGEDQAWLPRSEESPEVVEFKGPF